VIQAGKQQGMHTLDDSLRAVGHEESVDPEEAYSYADKQGGFRAVRGHPAAGLGQQRWARPVARAAAPPDARLATGLPCLQP